MRHARVGMLVIAAVATGGCSVTNALMMGQSPFDLITASEAQRADVDQMHKGNPCLAPLIEAANADGQLLNGEYRILIQANYRMGPNGQGGRCVGPLAVHQHQLRQLNAVAAL